MFKNRFLLIDFFGLVLAGTTSILFRAELSQAQEPPPKDVRHISLLVEQGFTLPAPSLARLNSGDVSDATGLIVAEAVRLPQQRRKSRSLGVTFTISGDARFENISAQGLMAITSTEDQVIKTSTIEAAPYFGESFIQVLIDGQPIVEKLRVATLEVGGIENLKKFLSGDDEPAVLAIGDHYAVVDESKLRVTEETVTIQGAEPSATGQLGKAGLSERIQPNADTQNLAAAGVCFRTPFGSGKVNWDEKYEEKYDAISSKPGYVERIPLC